MARKYSKAEAESLCEFVDRLTDGRPGHISLVEALQRHLDELSENEEEES